MAQRQSNGRTSDNRITQNQRMTEQKRQASYVYGNAVQKHDIRYQLEEAPRRQPRHEVLKNREKARHMSPGYVLFLMAALCMAGMILINYIQLQSELTNTIKRISQVESSLNTQGLKNDDELSRVENSIDLEEIKRIAIGELGMTYAKEGQIITYSNAKNDYMRQVTEEK